jgi:DNA-binding GntR family transcriptional regulator
MVVSGEMAPDARVSEADLARRLDVSRTPVREALSRLDGDGLVHAQGRGVTVRQLSSQDLATLFDARAGLESWAVYRVAQFVAEGELPPARLNELDAQADRADEFSKAGDVSSASFANREFHEAITRLARNPVIDGTLSRWWDQIIVATRSVLDDEATIRRVDVEHREILAAIRAGDATAARVAAEAHVLHTRTQLGPR